MALILYTWGNKLVNKQFMGVKPCPRCGNITEQYLKRQFFTMGIFYIPIVWIPTKRYYVCENCQTGAELDKEKFKELKAKYKKMPKKSKVLTAFKELEAIAPSLTGDDKSTDAVYDKITQNVKFTDEEAPFIKEMIESYFGYAAAIAAKAADARSAADAAQDISAAQAADGTGAEAVSNPETAAAAPARSAPVVVENPLADVPAPGSQTVSSADQPVRKRKWGWFAAGVVQTFIMLFGLLMLFVGLGDELNGGDIGFAIFMIVLFGVIPVGLTALFFWLFAKK